LLHAEVKALQEMHGISYKDAAHRLYHSEAKKLAMEKEIEREVRKLSDDAHKIGETISEKIRNFDELVAGKQATGACTDDS
jgi:hypothetical protein